MNSPLGRWTGATGDQGPDAARNAAKAAWMEHGVIMLRREWLTNPADRQQAEQLAEKLHGKRKPR